MAKTVSVLKLTFISQSKVFLTKAILYSAVLAHFMLNEKLHIFGVLGCVLCVVGSTSIVLHAPIEKDIESVKEVWYLATEPGKADPDAFCHGGFLNVFMFIQICSYGTCIL